MNDRYLFALLCGMVFAIAAAALTGRFAPEVVPDTQSYLVPFAWPQMLSEPRTPFYAFFIAVFGGMQNNFVLLPAMQALVLALATLSLYQAAFTWGVDGKAALALTLPIPFSNAALLFLNTVHPEILAIACVLSALAAVISFSAKPRLGSAILCGTGLCFGYLLKPAFVFFIPVVPTLYFLLAQLHGSANLSQSLRLTFVVLCVAVVPFLAYSGLRASQTGDFNIVSFGGVASVGMSGLMLTPATIEKLSREHRELAQTILAERKRLAQSGVMLPIPLNSQNERSFVSAALGYFDVLARSYDNIVYDVVVPQRSPEEGWVSFNARLQAFTVEVIKAEPLSYAAWVVGAATRLVGLITIANASFIVAFLLLTGLFFFTVVRGQTGESRAPLRDTYFLLLVVGAYTFANSVPMLLLTFPARRYVDTAGLLLAALPLLGVLRLGKHAFRRTARC